MRMVCKYQGGNSVKQDPINDYYTQRIKEMRQKAIHNMNTREFPMVFYSTDPAAYQELLDINLQEQQGYGDHIDPRYWESMRCSPEEAKAKAQEKEKEEAYDRLDAGLRYELIKHQQANHVPVPTGATCLYTVTDSYGRGVPGNLTWLRTYQDKGFRKLADDEELEEGDILQLGPDKEHPLHAVMFLKYLDPIDEDNQVILGRYSDGGYTPEALKTVDWIFIPSKHNAFRFVGNSADSARWAKEYKIK